MHKITRAVLTGGPCGGKTTALVFILERLEAMGVKTIIVPELATQYILAGVLPSTVGLVNFQKAILEGQMTQEARYLKLANIYAEKSPVVLLFDRGILDGAAFCSKKEWKNTCEELKVNPTKERDSRYDIVVHLVTAANGAEEYYTLTNNKARTETPAEAKVQDLRIQKAWIGHPKLRIIDNQASFRDKITKATAEIIHTVGLPEPIEAERKFLLDPITTSKLIKSRLNKCKLEIVQTYLLSPPKEERRLRKRSQDGNATFFYTKKRALRPGVRIEEDSIISEAEYNALLLQLDPAKAPVVKTRYCIIYKGQYLELDTYTRPKLPFSTLEVETLGDVELPIIPIKEVTGDDTYSNANLAKLI